MYNFDGDYRRRPLQNLGGVSCVSDRETLIKKAQQERQKRNELRKQNNGAIIIQSYTRSYLERQHVKNNEKINYDKFWLQYKDKIIDNDDNLSYLLKRLVFFYTKTDLNDCERLVSTKYIFIVPSWVIETIKISKINNHDF